MSTEVVVPKVLKTTHSQKNYGVSIVNAEDFWQEGYKGQEVNIAVIDSGFDYHVNGKRGRIWSMQLLT
ncbi:peptidase S8 [Bacillus pseudomycoides]|uniref:peptidase S8 n=1 Tax=Bacillus pseudomycoides TaxID=64104 RepID=UPI000BEE5063|nr:peptidase S8 [Bacillus pseudomycoides]MBD5797616.1 peptidase S8 [Bacillus pseudomycoides]PDZ10427.1 peptidase S8 [Bacillus pseudomycoides]PEO92571.1 peptidase S8 [Bacillus pseudomycoides]